MAKSWLDPDDSQTEIYAAPVARPTPSADDLMEIPSLVYAIGSTQQPHVDDRPLLTPATLALAALCVVVGVTLGSVIGLSSKSSTVAAAAPVVVMPIAPIVTAVPPPPTTLRIESTPPGATVMFVADGGATTLVGTTPIDTNVDPGRAYDVLVTLPNHNSRIAHVEPSSSHHLVIALAPTR
jgi:hypothetical protein